MTFMNDKSHLDLDMVLFIKRSQLDLDSVVHKKVTIVTFMNDKSLKKHILPLEIYFSNKNPIWWHFLFGKRSYYFPNISSKPSKNSH